MKGLALLTALTAASSVAAQEAPAEPDWGELLRADAEAVHATLLDSHPGPHNALDPGFMETLDAGRDLALARAETARDVNAYWWALREYLASFNDGHTQLGATEALPSLPVQWPGFATAYVSGRHRVVVNSGAGDPPVGADLMSCDGIDADRLAERNIGRFRGLWELQTSRIAFGSQLFRQTGNPYLHRPLNCVFDTPDGARAFNLTWRSLEDDDLTRVTAATAAVSARAREPIGLRPFGANSFWITASDFHSGADTENGQANTALIATIAAMAPTLRSADRIVFDLRGNNGGSSHWGREMARALWGRDYVDARAPGSESVDWRASDANIAHFAQLRDSHAPGSEMHGWLTQVVAGMEGARARGEPIWTERDADAAADPAPLTDSPVLARVYVLTDYYCASACLNAVDDWLAAGGVHVGQETAADSLYMDIRAAQLPSGYGQIIVPTKVYRGRPRGSNQALRPVHPYDGVMTDTAALEAWILTLP